MKRYRLDIGRFSFLICILLMLGCISRAQTILSLRPDSPLGQDTFIWDYFPDSSAGNEDRLDITGWTANGTPYRSRALIGFDLSSIPIGATINYAFLSLYHNYTDSNYNALHNGANASFLQRITTAWDEDSITWNNQPAVTTLNQLVLPATATGVEHFLNLDVTAMATNMVDSPLTSFGFMLLLQDETPYRDLIFASSNHADSTIRPQLVISFNDPVSIEEIKMENDYVKVVPNILTEEDNISISTSIKTPYQLRIYNQVGALVYQKNNSEEEKNISLKKYSLTQGNYTLLLFDTKGKYLYSKLVVQ